VLFPTEQVIVVGNDITVAETDIIMLYYKYIL